MCKKYLVKLRGGRGHGETVDNVLSEGVDHVSRNDDPWAAEGKCET